MRRQHREPNSTVTWHEPWCPVFQGECCACQDDDRKRRRQGRNPPLSGGEQPVDRQLEEVLT